MRILVFNWRDIKNPQAGGAELLTHELAKRWKKHGHTVTLFTSGFSGAKADDAIDGVTVIRRGRWWSVHGLAFFYYLLHFRSLVDVVVDEVHWYPFFSVLYARHKTVLLACEVANRLFFQLLPYPLALLGRWLEKIYLFIYRSTPVMAISPSTKRDLVAEGIDAGQITILPMGVTVPKTASRLKKSMHPTILFLGRLHPLKGARDAIDAFALIRKKLPSAKLWIVGEGQSRYKKQLDTQIHSLALASSVTFFGHVSERRKFELLAAGHLLLVPSVHEGWGLVVAEAAHVGTPAVGYRTAGIADVIVDGKTGVLVPPGNIEELALETLKLWEDRARYKRYQTAGKKRALSMNWGNTALVALSVLVKAHEKN